MRHRALDELLPAALTLLAGIATLAVAIIFKNQLPLDKALARPVGFVLVYGGIGLLLWSGMHIRSAIGGMVFTPLDELITTGPYRWVRHPVYLATIIAMLGVSIVTCSIFGLIAIFVLFLPIEWHRARLEDQALADKFGDAWREYASQVGAFVPGFGKAPPPQAR